MQALPHCRVCGERQLALFAVIDLKTYWRCAHCEATLLADAHLPTPNEELARYAQHKNDPHDAGYQDFLRRLVHPLMVELPPPQVGLDYGCGPGPALAKMLTEAGHEMHLYDPIFHPDTSELERQYDFITCTETVEHFHQPRVEFRKFNELLRPGGWLGVMTNFQTDDAQFAQWHYRRDPTHVTFYRKATFARIALDLGWEYQFPARNIVLMQKPRDMR
ncbi:MAG: class I SAM-dependent methyltransferase [Planctomycetota bacterium]|nr:class I SAM-dependent methyltransferase [Planctomycetota bacterium]MDA1263265.1 class I SAM-dependent methyltransferase [Planctomycetota bacterium]